MANPNSRETLKQYCLRRLGFPVIKINVDDDQLEDRIDDALQKYKKYHFDGTELLYVPHQITANNVSDKFITIDPMIERITRLAPLNGYGAVNNMFNFDYQFRLNDMQSLINLPITNYVITMQQLQMLQDIFVGDLTFEFNVHTRKLWINIGWGKEIQETDWILAECYIIVNPEVYKTVYNDGWLKEYTTELFRRQWGENMMKFGNLELPGGIILNGKDTFDIASERIKELEEDLENKYQAPPFFIVG